MVISHLLFLFHILKVPSLAHRASHLAPLAPAFWAMPIGEVIRSVVNIGACDVIRCWAAAAA